MHEAYVAEAIALAVANVASGFGGPFAAVIVKDGAVIAAAGNQVTGMVDPTAHAEVLAIRQACRILNDFQLRGCTLYSSCEPCPMCLGAIYWARLDGVYFAGTRRDAARAGFDDGIIYEELRLQPRERQIPFVRVRLASSREPFAVWLDKNDKTPY